MRAWLFKTLCALCVTLPVAAVAKSYTVPRIHIEVKATSDGLLIIEEELTYRFDGSFSYAYRDIPLKRGESVSDVTVSENGRRYRNERDGGPGAFDVSRDGSNVRVTWYYAARNETRTFKLTYKMTGAVTRYRDVTEVYFQFVGDGWDRSIGEVTVRVFPPDGVMASDVRAWAHGPLHGTVEIVAGGRVQLDVSPLPARRFWEGRILYPSSFFAGMPVRDLDARERIMAEERRWVEEANRRREARQRQIEAWRAERARKQELARRLLPIAILLGVAGVTMWFVLFRRHGKPYDVRPRTAPGDIPSDHPPVVVSFLAFRRAIGGTAIVATLLDLANRGYLEIEESVETKDTWLGRRRKSDYRFYLTHRPVSELTAYERDLLDFLLNTAGTGQDFTMSGLKKAASKQRTKFRKWFMEWIKQVKEYADRFDFYEPYPVRAMVVNAIVGVAIAATGVAIMVATDSPAGFPALVLGLLQAVLTVALNRHTREGRRLALAWRGFRSHLQKLSKAMGPVSMTSNEWGRYLSTAILFGMHKKLIPQLRIADDGGHPAYYPIWYHGAIGSDAGDMTALADGFSSMVSSVSSTMSSASGTGGGASGGGGGGSGGGGGGAG